MVLKVSRRALLFILFAFLFSPAGAQKFALVDMDYIFKNIPAYERANEQLSQVSKKWQAEVDALTTEAQTMYKNSTALPPHQVGSSLVVGHVGRAPGAFVFYPWLSSFSVTIRFSGSKK